MEDHGPRKIDQRVGDRCHLPVDHSEEPRRGIRSEEHIVELVVPVRQRGFLLSRPVVVQPRRDARGRREGPAMVGIELGHPAVDLSCEVGPGVSECTQSAPLPIHGVNRDEFIDQLIERLRLLLGVRGPGRRDLRAHGDAVDAFHDVERPAEDVWIVAGQDRAGDRDRVVLDRVEDTKLAQNVVRGRRAGVHRGAAQDPALVSSSHGEDLAGSTPDHRLELDGARIAEAIIEKTSQGVDRLGHRTNSRSTICTTCPRRSMTKSGEQSADPGRASATRSAVSMPRACGPLTS
jgi:hypothetical protein